MGLVNINKRALIDINVLCVLYSFKILKVLKSMENLENKHKMYIKSVHTISCDIIREDRDRFFICGHNLSDSIMVDATLFYNLKQCF